MLMCSEDEYMNYAKWILLIICVALIALPLLSKRTGKTK